jgi:uncharacterized damage-inducible protein DinB
MVAAMTQLDHLRRLWEHCEWADVLLTGALARVRADGGARRELAHVLGAEETWLARLERRDARLGVWPDLLLDDLEPIMRRTHLGYRSYLGAVEHDDLARPVSYVNSAGRTFATPVADILVHVALHGQYHRGKVNLLLRRAGLEPVPVDFIAFVRGAPAARHEPGGT